MATVVDLRTAGGVPGRGIDLGDLPAAPSGQVAAVVRRRWQDLVEGGGLAQGEADGTPVTRRTDWRSAALLAALLALGVVLQLAR
jgi:hypothetical protein